MHASCGSRDTSTTKCKNELRDDNRTFVLAIFDATKYLLTSFGIMSSKNGQEINCEE